MQWTTKDGRKLNVNDMSTQHIKNSLAMLKRKGHVSAKTLLFYLNCPEPGGDGAQMAFEEELDSAIKNANPFIDAFEEELKTRPVIVGDENREQNDKLTGCCDV